MNGSNVQLIIIIKTNGCSVYAHPSQIRSLHPAMLHAPQKLKNVISYGLPAADQRCTSCLSNPILLESLCAGCLAQERILNPSPSDTIAGSDPRSYIYLSRRPPLPRRRTWSKEREPAYAFTSSHYDHEGCVLPLYAERPSLSGEQLRAHAGTARNFALLGGVLLPGFRALWVAELEEVVVEVEPKSSPPHAPIPQLEKRDSALFYESSKWEAVVAERGRQYACKHLPVASLTELLVDMDLLMDGKGKRGVPLSSVCMSICDDADRADWLVSSRRKKIRRSGDRQKRFIRCPCFPGYQSAVISFSYSLMCQYKLAQRLHVYVRVPLQSYRTQFYLGPANSEYIRSLSPSETTIPFACFIQCLS